MNEVSRGVTFRRNVTKVQLPYLYLRNLTVASPALHWRREALCLYREEQLPVVSCQLPDRGATVYALVNTDR